MTDDRITEAMQHRLLEMLRWFDRFCRENGIVYYATGGTILGAVRHKGFIPWDDDVDLVLPRPDYERLIGLLEGKTVDGLLLEAASSDARDYCYPYAKLYDTGTTLIENKRRPVCRGLFLDIFPLDGAGDTRKAAISCQRRIKMFYNFYLTRVAGERQGRKSYKRLAAEIMQKIPDRIIDDRRLRIRLDEMCAGRPYEECEWVCNFFGAWGKREIFRKRVFGTPKEYAFEDMIILGPEYAGELLSQLYGDWKRLPPVEERRSHHDFLELDLGRSYLSGS